MASLMQWANEPWSGPLPFERDWRPRGISEEPTRLQVIAALKLMDGGGYGFMDGGGIYGRTGLEQQEAFVWWEMRGFVNGWIQGTNELEASAFFLALKAEWARVAALALAEQSPGAPPP